MIIDPPTKINIEQCHNWDSGDELIVNCDDVGGTPYIAALDEYKVLGRGKDLKHAICEAYINTLGEE